MVDGITNPSLSTAISNANKQQKTAVVNTPAKSADVVEESVNNSDARVDGSELSKRPVASSSQKRDDAAVVVDVSISTAKAADDTALIAEVNRAAAASEAPTTQELIVASNADRVAAALGNTVDIRA